MSHFILATQWSVGDVLPFIRIGKMLKKRGHDVDIITHHIYENEAVEAGLTFYPAESPEAYRRIIDELPPDTNFVKHYDSMMAYYRKNLGREHVENELGIIKKLNRPGESVLLLRSGTSSAALLAAEIYNIPVASVVLSPAFIPKLRLEDQTIGPVLLEAVNPIRQELGLPRINNWLKWAASPKVNYALWPKWFDRKTKQDYISLTEMGFPVERAKHEIPGEIRDFVNGHNVVLITGGTSEFLDRDFFKNTIEGCARLGLKSLVVTKKEELLPEKLPENTLWVKFLPFADVLPHMCAMIHHGGIGTLSAALTAGIPQLILPEGFDRPDNGVWVKSAGVGDFLAPDDWTPEYVARSLEGLLSGEVHKRIQPYAEELNGENIFEKICKNLEGLRGSNNFFVDPAGYTENEKSSEKNNGLSDKRKALLLKLLQQKNRIKK